MHIEFHELIQNPKKNYKKLMDLAQSIEEPHLCLGAPMSPMAHCFNDMDDFLSISPEKLELIKKLLPKSQPIIEESISEKTSWFEKVNITSKKSALFIIKNGLIEAMPMKDHFAPFIENLEYGETFENALKASMRQGVKIPDIKNHIEATLKYLEDDEMEFLDYIETREESVKLEMFQQLVDQGWDVNEMHPNELLYMTDELEEFLIKENVLKYSDGFIEITPLAISALHGDIPMFLKLLELGADPKIDQISFKEEVFWPLSKVFEYGKVIDEKDTQSVEAVYLSRIAAGAAQQAMQDILRTTPHP